MPKSKNLRVCLKKCKDDLIQELHDSNLHCLYSSICILWLSCTGNNTTVIDNCDRLCSEESILETLTVWNGEHAMKIFTVQKRVSKDFRIIINEEYYCQMRRIMIGKLWNIKQMHQRKIVNIAALFFQNMSNLVPSIARESKHWQCGCAWGGQWGETSSQSKWIVW